jgi:hypothetical protein
MSVPNPKQTSARLHFFKARLDLSRLFAAAAVDQGQQSESASGKAQEEEKRK